jgi:hypothetical protein
MAPALGDNATVAFVEARNTIAIARVGFRMNARVSEEMAQVFHSTDQLASPWPLAVRLFACLAGMATAACVRTTRWYRHVGGHISVPPVSSEWLLQHQIRSSKHHPDQV